MSLEKLKSIVKKLLKSKVMLSKSEFYFVYGIIAGLYGNWLISLFGRIMFQKDILLEWYGFISIFISYLALFLMQTKKGVYISGLLNLVGIVLLMGNNGEGLLYFIGDELYYFFSFGLAIWLFMFIFKLVSVDKESEILTIEDLEEPAIRIVKKALEQYEREKENSDKQVNETCEKNGEERGIY